MKHLTLEAWARRTFEKAPCAKTLRRWARDGVIHPPPVKPRKSWLVREDAVLIGSEPLPHGPLVGRI